MSHRSSTAPRLRRLTNFESLESRQLLAAVVVEGSLLSGDNIELTADAISLTVTGASSGNGTYALANISSLSIDAKAFNDKVTIKNSFTLPATSNISIIAEEIYVDPGVSITGGDITLRSIGDEHGLSVASNLPLLDIGDIFTGDRKIQIGAGASLTGKDITIEAERISSLLRIKTPFGFGKKDYASTIAIGKNLLVLTEDGNLILLEANPAKYVELGRLQVCGNTWSHPAYVDGKLYVRDGRSLQCIDLIARN